MDLWVEKSRLFTQFASTFIKLIRPLAQTILGAFGSGAGALAWASLIEAKQSFRQKWDRQLFHAIIRLFGRGHCLDLAKGHGFANLIGTD